VDIDRRQVLIGSAGVALGRVFGVVSTGPDIRPPGILDGAQWHPLTQSLLERASRIGPCRKAPDRTVVERTIRQRAEASGFTGRPVICMDTPSEAFDDLSRFGLDALLDIGTTTFWRRSQPLISRDVDVLDWASKSG
jgi:hypothetical protein